ncbi:MAG: amidohydrolase family protein [Pyrinomonadaceae bacterium]|nr:amidohydrolase family protein [Pyrinomonadaceae bacterium]MCX7640172.1 amidohydrolase family protein [Pyrinomonadaceae bacterium]MDW8303240.1 amidohydrolase family protein [Acidobacteriota bacterium]
MRKVNFLLCVLICFVLQSKAQTGVYAIRDAKVFTVSGATIERGTIVIRGGLIEAVGENVKVPADAVIIEGKGLTVYPGFFDTNSSFGLAARPSPSPTPSSPTLLIQQASAQQQVSSTSNYPVGLRPEIDIVEQLRAGDSQFETQRNNGFTTAVTVQREGIFNGQSAIINLAGETVSAMIVKSPFAQHITFRTLSGGVYPTSLLGTFSALRQMFLDAKRLQEWKKIYEANPRGIKRPESDRSLEALFPILEGKMPVIFNANTETEIIRALNLAKEFNIKAIIAGGQEAWKVADRLKAQNVPVLLSLNFPKRTAIASEEADPERLETLRFRVETLKCAGRLEKAGVRFAFQSGGIQNYAEIWTNLNRAIENGLSKEAAIKALTLGAAEILGVSDRLGSIETGKIANLVLVRGDLFAKDRVFTHTFVDGKLFEIKQREDRSNQTATSTNVNLTGVWNLTIEAMGQSLPATLNLNQQGNTLSGTLQTAVTGTTNIKEGKVTADGFSFLLDINFGGNQVEVTVTGKVTGNQMSGSIQSQQGTFSFSGTRTPQNQ